MTRIKAVVIWSCFVLLALTVPVQAAEELLFVEAPSLCDSAVPAMPSAPPAWEARIKCGPPVCASDGDCEAMGTGNRCVLGSATICPYCA